ncbi:unnamed protein product [Toxocara canis]|uniref:DUF3480 domain-containing protein n=1 Tax=Toxocara canis TaxID=6265 RepID=A0A183VGN4_TOXCA|nr:unnamed protein product [Toxocara canis]
MGLFGPSDPTVPASSNDVEQSGKIRTFSLGSTDTTDTRLSIGEGSWVPALFDLCSLKKLAIALRSYPQRNLRVGREEDSQLTFAVATPVLINLHAYQLSDNKASVNGELDGTFYEGYVPQVHICERLIAFFFVLWLDEKSQASLFFKSI